MSPNKPDLDVFLLLNAGLQGCITMGFLILIHFVRGATKLYKFGLYLSASGATLTMASLLLLPSLLMISRIIFGIGLLLSTGDAIRRYYGQFDDLEQLKTATYQLVLHCLVAGVMLMAIWMTALLNAYGYLPVAYEWPFDGSALVQPLTTR